MARAYKGWDNEPMTSPDNNQRRQAWSSYWSQGALHSCLGSFDANYSGAIGTFWDAQASDIAPSSRVLDLATGNGALPLRLWERHGRAADLRIDAVDLAALAPSWYRADTHVGIAFHSGVAMEALPFAECSFDWILSQFGLEYARRPEALDECLRVLAPDGRLAFVMHHAGSVLVSVGRSELANLELLLAPDGLIEAARGVIPWIARARSGAADLAGNADARRARARYNAAMAALAEAIAGSKIPDALLESRQWIHELLSGAHGIDADTQLRALDQYREGLRAAALRTGEMIEHALDAAQIEEIARYLREARPTCTTGYRPLTQTEGLLAWAVTSAPASATES